MPTLLLIDDDELIRRVLRKRLEQSYEILDTPDPEEGIVLALQRKPDAILLDLMMPKYSGFEVCQTLSSMSFTQRIPILIVSGESAERYREFCRNLGAKGFIQKPIDFAELRKHLEEVIAGRETGKRPEARVRFRTLLKLSGQDAKGARLNVTTVTENVTPSGFLCICPNEMAVGAVVEVHDATNGHRFVGKACVARVNSAGTRGQMCDFSFLDRPLDWVLP